MPLHNKHSIQDAISINAKNAQKLQKCFIDHC